MSIFRWFLFYFLKNDFDSVLFGFLFFLNNQLVESVGVYDL